MLPTGPAASELIPQTANDRMKRRAAMWQSNALVAAVLIHAAVLAMWPTMTSAVVERSATELAVIAPPETDVPDPPQQLARPAAPVFATADITEDLTPLMSDWNAWKPEQLTPPAATARKQTDDFVVFVPSMVPPRVLNQQEVERAMVRHYPPLLRDSGIGGDVEIMLWLDERGGIVRSEISRTSGHEALDQAALKVIDVMKLSPAINRDRPTRVIVTIPVVFRAHEPATVSQPH